MFTNNGTHLWNCLVPSFVSTTLRNFCITLVYCHPRPSSCPCPASAHCFCSYNYSRYRSDIPKAVSACLSHCVPCIKLCLLHNLATVLVECKLSSMLRIGSYMYIAIACEYNYQYTSHLSAETLALTYMYAIGTCCIRT